MCFIYVHISVLLFFFQFSRSCVSLCLPHTWPPILFTYLPWTHMDPCTQLVGFTWLSRQWFQARDGIVFYSFIGKHHCIHYNALFRNRWSEGPIDNMHAVIQSVNLREVESCCFLKTILSHPTSWVHGCVFTAISLLVCKQNWRGKHDTGVLHCLLISEGTLQINFWGHLSIWKLFFHVIFYHIT